MYFVFSLSLYRDTRTLTEEDLMGFRPLYRKIAEAIFLAIAPDHIHVSPAPPGRFIVPVACVVHLVTLAVSPNLSIQ